jgi:2-isopropylmalate synthase
VTGRRTTRNKAVVGEIAFAHASGIHRDGALKKRTTYEIMDPKAVGVAKSTLVLGKHSGRHQFRPRLKELGFRLSAEEIDHLFFGPFKALADRKGEIFDEDIEALVESEVLTVPETWRVRGLQVATGTAGMPTATVELEEVATGKACRDAATGDGPVDAIFRAVERLTGVSLRLNDYQIRSVTGGKEAQGEVRLEARYNDRTVTGRGVSTDVLEASARAFVNCINRALRRDRAGRMGATKKAKKKGKRKRARSKQRAESKKAKRKRT